MGEHLAADTWGISGPDFLGIYVLLAIAAFVASLILRIYVTRFWGRSHTELLNPCELGMLIGDDRAVLAAITQLRGAGLVGTTGKALTLSAADRRNLDPFSIAIYNRYSSGARTVRALVPLSDAPLSELRTNLTNRWYLAGPQFRGAVLLAAVPIDLVLLLGIARIVAGVSNGKPVAFLVALVVLQAIVWLFFLRRPRITARGRQALAKAHREMRFLNPTLQPSLATYGAAHAGLSAALFGGAALWLVDPEFAQSSEVQRIVNTGSSSSFDSSSTSSSCSSSSSSCSSGSSCGGGGGGCGG